MGYVNKTISKNETFIKQAKISKLSFLDRIIASVLFVIAGLLAVVDIFILDPITVGEQAIKVASIGSMAVGAILLLLLVLLALYRLVQAIGQVDASAVLPASVFIRLSVFSGLALGVGFGSYMLGGGEMICEIINAAANIVIGIIIIIVSTLRYKSIKLILSDRRISGRENIWLTKSFDIPIDKADNVVINFSFWGKMCNFATITIKSVMGEYSVRYVKAPEEFKNLIIDFTEYNGK